MKSYNCEGCGGMHPRSAEICGTYINDYCGKCRDYRTFNLESPVAPRVTLESKPFKLNARKMACGCCTAGCVCEQHANPDRGVRADKCSVHITAAELRARPVQRLDATKIPGVADTMFFYAQNAQQQAEAIGLEDLCREHCE